MFSSGPSQAHAALWALNGYGSQTRPSFVLSYTSICVYVAIISWCFVFTGNAEACSASQAGPMQKGLCCVSVRTRFGLSYCTGQTDHLEISCFLAIEWGWWLYPPHRASSRRRDRQRWPHLGSSTRSASTYHSRRVTPCSWDPSNCRLVASSISLASLFSVPPLHHSVLLVF